MSNTKHTPTNPPWKLERLTGRGHCNVGIRVRGELVSGYAAFINTRWAHPLQAAEQEANAAFIVRAVNSHEQLVAALRGAHGAIDALMAGVIELDPSFMPTKSTIWPALTACAAALAAAEA